MIPCPSGPHRAVISLLRAACGISLDPKEVQDILGSNPERIVRIAGAHVILPTLHTGLQAIVEQARLPDDMLLFFHEMQDANKRRRAAMAKQLGIISDLFAEHGITAVILKGGCELLAPAYRQPEQRFISDLDLLISPEQLPTASEVLMAAGCIQAEMAEINARTHHHLPAFLHPEWLVPVELHRGVGQDAGARILTGEQVVANAQTSDLPAIRIPSWPDRLTHLVIHAQLSDRGYPDRKIFLRHIVDLFQIAQHLPTEAWQATLEAFTREGQAPAFRSLLAETELLLPGRMPHQLIDANAERDARLAIDLLGRPGKARLREALRWTGWYLRMFLTDRERRRHYLARLRRPGEVARLIRFHRDRDRDIR